MNLTNPTSSLEVVLGGHPEAVELRPMDAGASTLRPTLVQARLRVAHDPSGAHEGHASRLDVLEAGDAPAQRLQVATPARFISLHAQTAGGGASVELIQEGSLQLATAGGAIDVARAKVCGPPAAAPAARLPPAPEPLLRLPHRLLGARCCALSAQLDGKHHTCPLPCRQAVSVDLDSGGGPISGSLSGVDVALRSSGGDVSLKRLEGRQVSLDSGGGDVAIVAAFGEQLRLVSGGGNVRLGSLNCQEGVARVSSYGGGVEVGGVDGGLQVASAGGPVSMQLNDRAGEVMVDSGGGDITLFVSPTLVGRLRVLRSGSLDASGGGRLAAAGGVGAAAVAAHSTGKEVGAPGNRVAPPPHAMVTLDAGERTSGGGAWRLQTGWLGSSRWVLHCPILRSCHAGDRGRIVVRQRSWMEAMQHRLRHGSGVDAIGS